LQSRDCRFNFACRIVIHHMKNSRVERLTAACTQEQLAEYHAFVDTSPQGIMYCKAWWLEAVAPGRWEVLVLRNDQSIHAAWPLVYGDNKRTIEMPMLTQKLGVLFAPSTAKYANRLGDEVAACDQLLDAIPDEMAVNQRFHEEFTNWLPFMWRRYRQTTRYTYVFDDLENVSDYMSRMTNDCRQRIRGAVKTLHVRETDDLQLMYELNERTFKRQGMKCPFSLALVERIHSACQANAGCRILVANDGSGNLHACDYMVYDKRCAVSLIQGADPQFRKGGAQRLLDWESINFAATVSKRFDFEGSVLPGVEPYNRGFGAKQMPYFSIWRGRGGSGVLYRMRSFIAKALRFASARLEGNEN
jgi:hypothetical protein